MAKLKFDKEITGVVIIDPYNDFISEGQDLAQRYTTIAAILAPTL
jgi:hypothetical protein